MTDEWDKDLTRLSLRATVLTLELFTAAGRDDGARLQDQATPVVDALFQLRLMAAIRAAGGRWGADAMLRDLPEVSPSLSHGLDCMTAGVTTPDKGAAAWLRDNGSRLENAFNAARTVHMAATAMKLNAVGNFAEFHRAAQWPALNGLEGTSEDVAIGVMSARARAAGSC